MPRERALLVTVELDPRFSPARTPWSLADEAQELKELTASAGCEIVGEVSARRHRPTPGTFLGKGKLEEVAQATSAMQGDVVVFSQELSPAQQRNIEEVVRAKTIDRTQLILDIFAQRANSQEGKVQVELAQLRYLMPRLVGKGIELSRLGGGIGTRGPGEQKLEVDRRRLRARITRLDNELEKLASRRAATRSRRKETQVPVAALVGYTNAGKTTLLNRLTGAGGLVRDQLFTTLDPLARRMRLPGGETVIVTDTVGFLHHLPHHLIEAFKATLEEARDADVLLHVLDASHPRAGEYAKAVDAVLNDLALRDKPLITVLNKRDRIAEAGRVTALEHAYAPALAVSAKTGEGIGALCALVEQELSGIIAAPTRLQIPADQAGVLAAIYRAGQVLRREEGRGLIELTVRLPGKMRASLADYIVP